jgi:putative hemolysin
MHTLQTQDHAMRIFEKCAPKPRLDRSHGATYGLRFARTAADLRAAQGLRFVVFNLELQEGLTQSYTTGLDCDRFDAVCDHLLVEHMATGQVVGTYRMQTGIQAQKNHGYYCAQEFDFAPYAQFRPEIVELGRACIHAEHRNFTVLSLLWKGVATYARDHGARYLLGCSSLTSQDPVVGASAYAQLASHLAPQAYQTKPLPAYSCALEVCGAATVKVPKLLSAYLALGSWICGPPALDRDFKTIDFLTLMDLQSPQMAQRRRRFGIG